MKRTASEAKIRKSSDKIPSKPKPLKKKALSNPKATVKHRSKSVNTKKSLFMPASTLPSRKNPFKDYTLKKSLQTSLSDASLILAEETFYKKLTKDLKHLKNPEDAFDVCQRYFSDLIKVDKQYSKSLTTIKSHYDIKLAAMDSNSTSRLNAQLKETQSELNKERLEKQLLKRKFEKLASENVEVCRLLDDAEKKYNALVERFQKISQYDDSKLPKEEITWKALAYENKTLVKFNKELQSDVKAVAKKEKALINLLVELNKQGYPIAEVYEKQQAESKRSLQDESILEDTDNEAIVTGRTKTVEKPSNIPKLKLESIEPEDFESESNISELY